MLNVSESWSLGWVAADPAEDAKPFKGASG